MKIERDQSDQFAENIKFSDNQHLVIIVGKNNSGKTTLLRGIAKATQGYLITVNRTVITGEGPLDRGYINQKTHYEQNPEVENIRRNEKLNKGDNQIQDGQILQDIFLLNDTDRNSALSWYNNYFPTKVVATRQNPNNEYSHGVLKDDNGHSITQQGSGMRASLEIFVKLCDPNIKVLCIDEPELGLEPRLQSALFQAIKEKAGEEKKIFIATHSHHFLDHENITNNYKCERDGNNKITVNPLRDPADLREVVFNLLGNNLTSLLLPEYLLIVEGISDVTFMKKCLELLDKKNYHIFPAGGDGNIKYAAGAITQFIAFKNFTSVYKGKTYIIADAPPPKNDKTQNKVKEWQTTVGDDKICVLKKNAIEYYYPETLLREALGKNNDTRDKDAIIQEYLEEKKEKKDSAISKTDLATEVANNLKKDHLNESDDSNDLFVFLKNLPPVKSLA